MSEMEELYTVDEAVIAKLKGVIIGLRRDLAESQAIPRKEVISIQTGDVIVITVPCKINLAEAKSLTQNVAVCWPDNKCLILDEGATLEVYRDQEKV